MTTIDPVLSEIICLIKIGTQTDRQTDGQTDGQTNIYTDRRQTNRQTDRQKEMGNLFLGTLGVMKGRENVRVEGRRTRLPKR